MFDIHRCQRTGTFVCAIALSAFSLSGQAFAQYGNSTPVRPIGSSTMEMRPNQQAGQADVMLTPAAPPLNQVQQQQPLPRPQQQPVMQQPQEFAPDVLAILKKWEQFGAQTQKLEGKHSRLVYDNTFKVKKVSQGEFYYETPDKGRIDLYAVDLGKNPAPEKGPTGELFQVQSETPESWICDGQMITHIDLSRKEYEQIPIPQEAQGQNIIDSPLPFLFGLTVEKAKNRYSLKVGDRHQPEKGLIHLVAKPLLPGDAAEWSEAEVMLDATTFLPIGIKLLAPGGDRTTVYSFKEAKRNKDRGVFAMFGKDPFHPSLSSFKKSQMNNIQEAGNSQPAGGPSSQTARLPGTGPR